MPAPEPSLDCNAFEALVTKSGLTLTEAQKSELYAAYGYVEAMAATGACRRQPTP